ncbi:hypothetical protein PF005_g33104 [Phytophthora fragariae]|uniref:Uncharacterized protein n=1 Tax=Phytophthora fragariae TaxID=53985 RepID=A0A6A3UZE2_9STRA|nr:hypothetical protein PF009_g32930 [Phytophthora fragariae]KAE8952980.1 hypothetical protein PF011_g32541 [Phytophthora fragariae]KAE9054635.1 hypothetical protein PF007_g32568 [Phytophthora fragariae]KAE9055241.1 hypothetical protein PF006_g33024 [Phytophthora fragariae]KAE9156728.1 hypothetical protein PF005_g33104 [Phytophthora fragariae]
MLNCITKEKKLQLNRETFEQKEQYGKVQLQLL